MVTGGGSGIGRAVAVALAREGMDVLVVGRRREAVAATTALTEGIRSLAADVASPAEVDNVIREAAELHGRIDLLVNNAAILRPGMLADFDVDSARAMWETNVLAPTMLAKAALPYLAAARGSIVNVSSTFGAKPAPGVSQYGASKAAVEQLTRSWALELADQGVRVNAIAPGPTESEGLARSGMSDAEIDEVKETERQRVPLRRRGLPEDIAHWVVAMADPAAGWTTGVVLPVDGGYLLA